MKNLNKKVSNFVLGAGISGLSAQKSLQKKGLDIKSFESNPLQGGLTKSLYTGDFTFDHTGHLLHLAKHDSPEHLLNNTKNSHWLNIQRKAGIFISNKIIPAPFQYNIGSLNNEQRDFCIDSFESKENILNPKNLNEYFESNFGHGINSLFLTPYNEKLYDEPISSFSLETISRFFPKPDTKLIRQGFSSKPIDDSGYNSRFWYPEKKGIQVLVDSLSEGLDINLNSKVEKIDLNSKNILIQGKEYAYDNLVSSIPLKTFIGLTDDKEMQLLASKLSISSTKVFNIGYSDIPDSKFEGYHWIYFPEKKYKFHRVGFYSNFSNLAAPKGCTSLYVEVGYSDNVSSNLRDEIINQLEEIGVIKNNKIECINEFNMKDSYVKFLHGSKESSIALIKLLEKKGIYKIGRYGRWDYNSMEDSILDGRDVHRRMAL
jgi:protoporphyrinogen oxidase